jgi:hypothetical protein
MYGGRALWECPAGHTPMEATAKIVCDRLHAGMTLECNTQRISKFSLLSSLRKGGRLGGFPEVPFDSDYSVGDDTLSFLVLSAYNKEPGNLMFFYQDPHHGCQSS